MADTRPSRRQAAMQGEKRSRVMLDSDRSSTSEEESPKSPKSPRPMDKEASPEPEDEREYWVETWWFDNGRQGFTRGRTAKYSSKQIESATALRQAAQQTWSQPRMLVRFIVTTYEDGIFSYEVSGRDKTLEEDDVVENHVTILREDPNAAQNRKLRIVFHEPGKADAVRDVVKQRGFPIYTTPT